MTHYVARGALQVAKVLADLVEKDIFPPLSISSDLFWNGLQKMVAELAPKNAVLMQKRQLMQRQIDDWYQNQAQFSVSEHKSFLRDIGYLLPEGEDFSITTANVDAELSTVAGPQLVVPVSNARFSLNAANARWGSLFDALYGTDVIPDTGDTSRGNAYNPARGAQVIAFACQFLDRVVPLAQGSHADVTEYLIEESHLVAEVNGGRSALLDARQFAGFRFDRDKQSLSAILLRNNGLHIEVKIDRDSDIGKSTASGMADVIMEAAISTIQDFEDSVSAVDAEEKTLAYRNWLGLMRGDLAATFSKHGETIERRLNTDRVYTGPDGLDLVLPGRSLMMVRNVGHAMITDAVLDADGNGIPETFLDVMVSTACALYDLKGAGSFTNSRAGSMYIVKPKMHGPEEVAFSNELFAFVEQVFELPRNTLKVGVMDEERRTTVNLKECIRQVSERLVFINTGFLDRTADEIHTCMEGGPVLPKETIKSQPWILAYENWNVDIGLACGLKGKAQIGKGMWAKPDAMAEMVATKAAHPRAGANCAWVPSPTAAVLHAMHYHEVDVSAVQDVLSTRARASLDDILLPPFLNHTELSESAIKAEVDNNVQSILGYVVRWIDQGIGCSKVPDINNTGLMEDRATLRISSQHLANWLRHGIINKDQLLEAMQRLARIVDQQNAGDPAYVEMAIDFDASLAFRAACELVFQGCSQPNGYTESILHDYRRMAKAQIEQYSQLQASISS